MTAAAPPSATPTTAVNVKTDRAYWRGFDLLRGLAAVMMVVNHTAYLLTARDAAGLVHLPTGASLTEATALQWAVLLGGFAPVVFFFVTGLGYGVQAGGPKRKSRFGLTRKVLILFAADALMWRQAGYAIGLDFFGFIAVSMLALAALLKCDSPVADAPGSVRIVSLPRSAWFALLALGVVLGLRFVLGPVAERFFGVAPDSWLNVLTGRNSDPDLKTGVSFPPIPWLAYPLAGFVLGAWLQRHRAVYLAQRTAFVMVVAVAGLALAGLTAFMIERGFPLYRWGTMSVASVVAGFAVMAGLVAVASAVEDLRGSARAVVDALSLRGIAAFSVVPLHFAMIGIAQAFGYVSDTAAQVWLALVVVTVLSMLVAPRTVTAGNWLRGRRRVVGWWGLGVGVTVLMFVLVDRDAMRGAIDVVAPVLGLDPAAVPTRPWRRIAGAAGQVVLCLMLVLPAVAWWPGSANAKTKRNTETDLPAPARPDLSQPTHVRESGPPTPAATRSM